ncbi:hypothetical protein ACOQ87_000459 [Campylobacter coli]
MVRLDIGDYYTRKEVANLLKVKEPIVHKYAKQGKFREFKQHRNCSGLYPKQDCRRKNKMSQKKNKMSYFCDKLSFFQP